MPSGSKRRKAAKKKKERELHAQTASIASPEESGNEHEDDVHKAQTGSQVGDEGEKDRAFGVESGSPICRTNVLNQESFAEEHIGEVVEHECPEESLEVSVNGPHGGRDESKQGDESYVGESDIQKVGSQEFYGTIQIMGARRVSDQKTTNGLVELPPAEAGYESESKKSLLATYQEGRNGADCQEDQAGYAMRDSVVRAGLDGEAPTDLEGTQGFKEESVTAHQELSSGAASLKLELPVMPPDSVAHAVSAELQEEQGGQGINASLAYSRLGAEASSHCKDTQGFGKDSVMLDQDLGGDSDSLKLEPDEYQPEQGGHDSNARLVHWSLEGEASTMHDFVKDSVVLHGKLSCYSDSSKLKMAGSPLSVVPEVQEEEGGHAINHGLVHSSFMDKEDVEDSVMPHGESNIQADSLKSEPDSTPVSVVHTKIVEFEQEQGGHGINGSLDHSRLDGEASTHSDNTGDVVGKDSAKAHTELSSDGDLPKVESDVTPVHTDVVEFHQEQGGHAIDDGLVLSRLDGEASSNFEDTEGFLKDSVIVHQESNIVVDSPKKSVSAPLLPYVVCPEAQEQAQEVKHSLVQLSLADEAGDQFKYTQDFAKEVSIPANGEKDSDAYAESVLPGNRLSDISNNVEDTHITSSASLIPRERDSIVTDEGDSSLELKVDKHMAAITEPIISSSKEVSRNDSDTSSSKEVSRNDSDTSSSKEVSRNDSNTSSSKEVSRNDSGTSWAVGGDTQTSLNERDMHHLNAANQVVAVRRGLLASWKSCCGFLELFRSSPS